MRQLTSWEYLESSLDPAKGPISKEFGFLHEPEAMSTAPVVLPAPWIEAWKNLSSLYLSKDLRNYCKTQMRPISAKVVEELAQRNVHTLMKAKCIVYCITQAWVDCERRIAKEMQEPPSLPATLEESMAHFASVCKCPQYCTLADMSLTAPVLRDTRMNLEQCTFDDFRLACPVFSSTQEPGSPFVALAGTGLSEQRFHNTPTMMEFRTAKLAGIFARIQQHLHALSACTEAKHTASPGPQERITALQAIILEDLNRSFTIVERLFEGFALLTKHTVDPVDWHENIVKYTSGYHGNLGMSGPQTPCIHLIDAFIGRNDYSSELGQTTKRVFLQIQVNHREFIRAISRGPSIRDYARSLEARFGQHPIATAYNQILDSYCQGFLAVHKARAMEFALKGFTEAGPREFTAETEYTWPAPRNVVDKLRALFDDAREERERLKL